MAWTLTQEPGQLLPSVVWPDRCVLCGALGASEVTLAVGDRVTFTAIVLSAVEWTYLRCPCCLSCHDRLRKLKRWALGLMVAPWPCLMVLPFLWLDIVLHFGVPLLMASLVFSVGLLTMGYRRYLTRAVQLIPAAGGLKGIEVRGDVLANELCELNGLIKTRRFFPLI